MKVDGSDQNGKGKALEHSTNKSLKDLLNSEYVKNRFLEVMGEKAPAFLASVLNAIQKNPELAKCDQQSVLSSAMVAATLDLPVDSNLGFSAIVPYNTKIKNQKTKEEYWVTLAQFQIMYKGFIQLALRSGQYKTINVSPIYEDEFESYDIISGDIQIRPVANGYREQENIDKIIGYVAFFRLINGFERLEYWPLSKIKAHGERYSKSFNHSNGLWKKDPHAMYAKTVLKNTLSKWGILSVSMQNAIVADQGVIRDFRKPIDGENVNYIDTKPEGEAFEATNQTNETDNNSGEAGAVSDEQGKEEPAQADTAQSATKNAPPDKNGALFPADEAADLKGVKPPDFGN